MKIFAQSLVAALFLAAATTAQAISVSFEEFTTASGDAFAISLEDADGSFDTFSVAITPDDSLLNVSSTGSAGFDIFAPGADFSFPNALLSAPPAFGGSGFSILTPIADSTGLTFGGGPLGGTISSATPIFLGQALFPSGTGGTAEVVLENLGSEVASFSLVFGAAVDPFELSPAEGTEFELVGIDTVLVDAITATGGTIDDVTFDTAQGDLFFDVEFDADSVSISFDPNAPFASTAPGTLLEEGLTVSANGETFGFTVTAVVPEPASFALLGVAAVGFFGRRRQG